MPIAELRAHVAHAYAEFYNECGYCWLEGEANAGEYGGGGYDSYNLPNSITGSSMTPTHPMTQEEVYASHQAALAPRDMSITDRRYLAMDDMTRHMYDLGRGGGGEYAPEPAYENPFALVGSIGGFLDREHLPSVGERFYNAYRWDIMMGMQVRRPIDMIIVSGIS
jgi:hypothetical protein